MADDDAGGGAAAGESAKGGAGAALAAAAPATSAGAEAAEADKGAAAAPAPAAGQGEKPWYGDLKDASLADYAKAKGWASVEQVIISAREAEKLALAPEKLPLPKEGDAEGWNAVFKRLGRPDAPDGYELGQVKLPEGYTPHQPLVDAMAKLAHEAGVSKQQMTTLYAGFAEQEATAQKAMEEERDAKADQQVKGLEREMGGAWKEGLQDAGAAMKELGLTGAEIDQVGHVIGHDRALKLLMKIGKPLREDSAGDTLGGGGGFSRMDPGSARSRIDELTKDKAFRDRLLKGDVAAKQEWDALNRAAAAKSA